MRRPVLLSIFLLTAVAAHAQAPVESTSVTASGRVIDAGTGRPVPGAIVTPAGGASLDVMTQSITVSAGPTPRILTNTAGYFEIRGLHNGTLILTATKGGYIPATYGQRRPAGSTQGIPIAEGKNVTGLEIRMWKHAAITGTIVDEAGDPVVGTSVEVFERRFVAGRRRFSESGRGATDDRGVYRVAGLIPGDYVVGVVSTQTAVPSDVMNIFFGGGGSDLKRAELGKELQTIGSPIVPAGSQYATSVGNMTLTLPPGTAVPTARADGTLAVYPTTYYPVSSTIAEAATVSVTSGQERGAVDIQLQAVRTVRVSGSLIAPPGMAANVGIRLIPAGPDLAVNDVDAATTITDETGGFTFPGVPPGQYVLRVVRVPRLPPDLDDSNTVRIASGGTAVPTSLPPPAGAAPPPIPLDATLFAEVPLNIGDHELSNLVVPLRVGPRMSGHVEFDGSSDHPDQQALANVRITLDPADGSPAAPGLSFVTGHPDETGQFTTYGVPSGKYVVRVAGLAFPDWVLKGVFYQGHDLTDEPIDMTSSDITSVTLTLTDRPASLGGTVSSGGVPDSNAVVLAYPRDATAWTSSGALSRRMRVARPGADGTYTMPHLAAGEYNVVAVEEDLLGDWQDPALLEALSRQAEHVRVLDGDHKLVNLRPSAIR